MINEVQEVMVNWDEYYPGAREELLVDMPIPKGKDTKVTIYVDTDQCQN